MNEYNFKKDFDFFKNNPNLIYLDSAASSQKVNSVINCVNNYYKNDYSNIHRGLYSKSLISTELFEESRETVANFINTNSKNIIFTKGATESINLIANGLNLNQNDEILISTVEHHANLVPWINLSNKKKIKLNYFNIDLYTYNFDFEDFKKKFNKNIKIVSFSACSNVLGTKFSIERIVNYIKKLNPNCLILIDATALIPHEKINVKKLNVDFLVFSSHKIYGPSGVGVLYISELGKKYVEPSIFGGDMINEVYLNKFSVLDFPQNMEAGTPNIEGVICFSKAIEYIQKIGYEKIKKHESNLMKYFLKRIEEEKLDYVKFYGITDLNKINERVGIFSFTIDKIHPHDIGSIFAKHNIAIRVGHHCAMPLHNEILKISSTARISFGIYNDFKDIDKAINILKNIYEYYEKGDFLEF
jgi:cysteine desulfurase/selenocysteine lyase